MPTQRTALSSRKCRCDSASATSPKQRDPHVPVVDEGMRERLTPTQKGQLRRRGPRRVARPRLRGGALCSVTRGRSGLMKRSMTFFCPSGRPSGTRPLSEGSSFLRCARPPDRASRLHLRCRGIPFCRRAPSQRCDTASASTPPFSCKVPGLRSDRATSRR